MTITTKIEGTLLHLNVGSRHMSFDATKAHTVNRTFAEMDRWRSRFVDAVAAPSPEAEKGDTIQSMIDHYQSGSPEWRIGVMSTGCDAVRAVMRALSIDLPAARSKIEENAKKLKVSEATMRQRLVTLPGPVRDAYVAMLDERGLSTKGETLLGDFV